MYDRSLNWKKSSKSNPQGACLYWAIDEKTNMVHLRESEQDNDANQPVIKVRLENWMAFVAGIQAGDADEVFNSRSIGGRIAA